MARKKGQYEMTLEDRHLLGVFFAVVLLCALFFTLGFVLGRNQPGDQAATAARPEEPAGDQTTTTPEDLSFYERVEKDQPPEAGAQAETKQEQAAPPPASGQAAAAPTTAVQPGPGDQIWLQVAAVTQQGDAERLAAELKKLGFPPHVAAPQDDRFYRVQVGPFDNEQLAESAIRRLQAQGFRDILVKR